jgi:1,4-dihydroxy-2-naphthoyl-CoA hydrolase
MTMQHDPKALLALMPLAATLEIEIESVGPDEVIGSMAWAPQRCTAAGVLHGGALVSLADCMAGLCAYVNLPSGAATSTIELKINYFAAVRAGTVVAVARPLHRGRTVIVVQTDLFRTENGMQRVLIGQVTQTQAVLQ